MHTAWKFAGLIVPGGIVAGAMMANLANPVMKDPPAQWWQGLLDSAEAAPADPYLGAYPEEPSPHDGYRPDMDYDLVITDWSPHYPSWAFSDLASEPPPLEDFAFDPPPLPAYEADAAADQAELVAAEAEAAETPAQPEVATIDSVRKSELVAAGLY